MYSSLGSLAALLLLIGACAAMLYRIDRFEGFVDNGLTELKGLPKDLAPMRNLSVAPSVIPDASDGHSSAPSDLTKMISDMGLAVPSLQQGNSFTATKASPNEVDQLKQQVADLESQNKKQVAEAQKHQYEMNMYKERQEKKRCPDISQYIRKDSIPCYNCSL